MPLLGAGALGQLPLGASVGTSVSIADTLNTLLEHPELARSWWLRARPLDTNFDMYLRLSTSEYVDFGNILSGFIGAADSFSFQIRTKRQSSTQVSSILGGKKSTTGAVDAGFFFSISAGGKFSVSLAYGNPLIDFTKLSDEVIDHVDFAMYTVVVDRSVNELRMYKNSTEQSVAVDITTLTSMASTNNFYLGRITTGGQVGCDIDEFRFWSKALTQAEIAAGGTAKYNAQLDTDSLPANLELYCQMNEGAGSTLTDETANGYDGTITGGEYLPVITSVNLSTDGHRTFPTDSEEIQLEQAVVKPYSLAYELSGELYGQVDTNFGEISIADPSLSRRSLAALDWTGRDLDIYIGPRRGKQIQFTNVANLLSRSIRYDSSVLTLIADDYSYIFDRYLQSNFYGGTGGLDGDTEIQGEPIPIWMGVKRQVEPKLVDAANLIYQLNDGTIGAMDSITAVRDQGVDKSFDTDVADITTATPGVGEYATSLAGGYIKLGDKNGRITVDAQGLEFPSYGYIETIADLIVGLAVDFAGLEDPINLDPVAFTTLASDFAGAMGQYFDKPTTIRQAMNVFHRSAMSWGWLRPNKVLTVGRITDPDTASEDFSIDVDCEEVNLVPWRMDPFEVPVGRVFVGYRRYPVRLNESELDSSVTVANRLDWSKEYRFAKAEDEKTFAKFSDAKEITILTDLDDEADAQTIANEQLAMRKVANRRVGTMSLRTGLITRGVGQAFRLTDSRLPDSPKQFVVIGVRNEAAAQGTHDIVELTVYG